MSQRAKAISLNHAHTVPDTVKGTASASNIALCAQEFVTIVAARVTINDFEAVAVDGDDVAF